MVFRVASVILYKHLNHSHPRLLLFPLATSLQLHDTASVSQFPLVSIPSTYLLPPTSPPSSPFPFPNYPLLSLPSSTPRPSISSSGNNPLTASHRVNRLNRNNPAVLSQPAKVFGYIAEALKAETLQGQAATRSVAAAKQLLSHPSVVATTDPSLILQSLDPDTMSVVREYFG